MEDLRYSIQGFNLVGPILVRNIGDNWYETISRAQRLTALQELGFKSVPGVVGLDSDAEAWLLGRALNHVEGTDNLGLRARVLQEILESKSQEQVLALLQETAVSLLALTVIVEQSLAQTIQQWEKTQRARLRHLAF